MNDEDKKYSNLVIVSFSLLVLIQEMYNIIFGTYVFFFYETEVKLGIVFLFIGYIIYAVWNAINDPLIGYLTDRPRRFWKRYGKRFPYITIGIFPWILSWALIFSPPDVNPVSGALILLAWFIFSACLYDTFYSIVSTNTSALYPDKFRLDNDRRKYSASRTFLGFIGLTLGALIPPMFIIYSVKSSYATASWIIIIIGLIVSVFFIPGAKEDEWIKEQYIELDVSKEERLSFIRTLKMVVKQKNYRYVFLVYLMSDVAGACLMASLNYVLRYVLKEPAGTLMILMIFFLLGSILSIPIWLKLSQKLENNRKLLLVACIFNVIVLASATFLPTLLSMMVAAIFLGIGMAGFKVGIVPCVADSLDEVLITHRKHMEGSYMGLLIFFLRLALIIQALIFLIIHVLTGFNPYSETQTPSAILGIRLHFGLIPAILFLIGILIFYKFYDLTPEKTKEVKLKIKDLKL